MDYVWPTPAKVRDFSRAVPVSTGASSVTTRSMCEVIGWIDGWPVAAKRKVGKGTLVFLGSPLGPALWSGDREAHRWLGEVLACT